MRGREGSESNRDGRFHSDGGAEEPPPRGKLRERRDGNAGGREREGLRHASHVRVAPRSGELCGPPRNSSVVFLELNLVWGLGGDVCGFNTKHQSTCESRGQRRREGDPRRAGGTRGARPPVSALEPCRAVAERAARRGRRVRRTRLARPPFRRGGPLPCPLEAPLLSRWGKSRFVNSQTRPLHASEGDGTRGPGSNLAHLAPPPDRRRGVVPRLARGVKSPPGVAVRGQFGYLRVRLFDRWRLDRRPFDLDIRVRHSPR